MDFASTSRAAENRIRLTVIVPASSVVSQRAFKVDLQIYKYITLI